MFKSKGSKLEFVEVPVQDLAQSKARLDKILEAHFNETQKALESLRPQQENEAKLFCRIANDEKALQEIASQAKDRHLTHLKEEAPKDENEKADSDKELQTADSSFSLSSFPHTWTWNSKSDNAIANVSAAQNGQISFSVRNGDKSGASASAAVAVGFTFRPLGSDGILDISSLPSILYSYWTSASLGPASTHAWMGLYVSEFTNGGGFLSAPVNQKIDLWTLNHNNFFRGSSSGFPLKATMKVVASHYYEVWVWAGGEASGTGSGVFSVGWGGSNLSVGVPYIQLHLFD